MSTDSMYYKYNPEKRNVFIEINKGRTNFIGQFITDSLLGASSHTSSICEVFSRKRFGERYITLAQSIGIFLAINFGYMFLDGMFRFNLDGGASTLFLFSCVYLGFSIKHRMEISKYGTAYDFKRFSLSDGEISEHWNKIIGKKLLGRQVSYYTVVTLLEPALFFLIGLILCIPEFSRAVGVLIATCGVSYGVKNFSKAQQGRNWVLDNIDKKICNELKYDVFIGRKPKKDTKGVYLPINLPLSDDVRKELYDMVEDSFSSANDIWASDELDGKSDGSAGARGGRTGGSESGGGRSTEEGRQRDGKTETGGDVGNGKTKTQKWSDDGQETGNG